MWVEETMFREELGGHGIDGMLVFWEDYLGFDGRLG